jgi:hypothetical protein
MIDIRLLRLRRGVPDVLNARGVVAAGEVSKQKVEWRKHYGR